MIKHFRQTVTLTATYALLAGLIGACKQGGDSTAPTPTAKAEAVQATTEAKTDVEAKSDKAGGKVTVTAEGTKFDPPVSKDKLPPGAWVCDMGTVHFARSEKGDGKCGVCGMNLTRVGEETAGGKGGAHNH